MGRGLAYAGLLGLVLLCLGATWGDRGHDHHPRARLSEQIVLDARLTSDCTDVVTGTTCTFTRASVSTCQATASGASVTDLTAGTACRDTTLGTRVAPVAANLARQSEALDLWTAAGTTVVTQDAAVAPDGSATAERVQLPAVSDGVSLATTNLCIASPHNEATYSISLRNRGVGTCTVWLGNNVTMSGTNRGTSVTVSPTWSRQSVLSYASLSGDCETRLARASAADTCTDLEAWGAQIVLARRDQGQYCPVGAGAASCNGEVLTLDASRFPLDAGRLTMLVSPGEDGTWGQTADGYLFQLEASTTFGAYFEDGADALTVLAGGQTVTLPMAGAPIGQHYLQVTWLEGSPITVQWDDVQPVSSSGAYTAPALAGGSRIFIGSSSGSLNQLGAFYSNLRIYNRQFVRTHRIKHLATFASSLTPETGGSVYLFTAATARTCPAVGLASLDDVAIDIPCYVSTNGTAIGVRIEGAKVNYCDGDMRGADAATPASWTGSAANWPKVTVGTTFHGQAAGYTAAAGSNPQVIYEADVWVDGPALMSWWTKNVAGANGNTYHMTDAGGTTLWATQSLTAWTRRDVSDTITGSAAIWNYAYWGDAIGNGTPPTSGTYYVDAIMCERSATYPGSACLGGAPPTSCAAESLTYQYTTAEIDPARWDLWIYVVPQWASTEAGIDRTVLYLGADWTLTWDTSDRAWLLTAGGQTAQSATQSFFRDSGHWLHLDGRDGYPIHLAVDGQAAVTSSGDYVTTTPAATAYIGSGPLGGDELGGHIGWIESR